MQMADSKCMAMNSMKDSNEKLQETFRAQNDALRLENLKLEKHVSSAGREAEKLKTDIQRLTGKNLDLRANVKELELVVDHLNHDLMSIKKSSGQFKTTTEIQLNDLQEKYIRVQQSESSLSIQIYDFQSKIEELNEEITWRVKNPQIFFYQNSIGGKKTRTYDENRQPREGNRAPR
jgi:chromosome segregation ATPase